MFPWMSRKFINGKNLRPYSECCNMGQIDLNRYFVDALTLTQTSPCFYVSAVLTSLLKPPWEKENLLVTSNFSFFHSVYVLLDNFLPFQSSLELLSPTSLTLEESKICRFGKG